MISDNANPYHRFDETDNNKKLTKVSKLLGIFLLSSASLGCYHYYLHAKRLENQEIAGAIPLDGAALPTELSKEASLDYDKEHYRATSSTALAGTFKKIPRKRKAMYNAVVDGNFIIFGGRGHNQQVLDDVWAFNFDKGWRRYQPDGSTWPAGRFNGCFMEVEGSKMMMFGGDLEFYGSNKPNFEMMSNEIWTLRKVSNSGPKWTKNFPLDGEGPWSLKRGAPACGVIPSTGEMFVMGGRNANDKIENYLWRIDLNSQRAFTVQKFGFSLGSIDPPRSKGSCAVSPPAYHGDVQNVKGTGYGTIMYLHGGRLGNRYRNTFFTLERQKNTGQMRWRKIKTEDGIAPQPRNHHGCTYSPGRVWIFGGRSSHRAPTMLRLHNDLWYYDISKNLWNEIHPVTYNSPTLWPSARFLPALAYDKTRKAIYLFGGQLHVGKTNDMWNIDIHDEDNPEIKLIHDCRGRQ